MDIQNQVRCISHEIRNHLSICELYSEIINKNLQKEHIKNPSIENAISCIKKSLQVMSNCLVELKSMDNLVINNYDIRTLLMTSVEMSKVYVQDKNIKIETNLKDTATVSVDENKFIACVVNIIKNAIEAITSDGKIIVTSILENGVIKIKILNNGEMISESKQKNIFSEGFTTKRTGSGLGLYICKQNLEAQGADLKLVKSTKKETIFEIDLKTV
ncbi:MAG: HAMP domain-containing histidine kinase [Clostridiaceae bacterium]|jgi:signal transduction histidine kinase|nr:HAMP domain-containing histidine kinase [Clostridiaceae bacterium]